MNYLAIFISVLFEYYTIKKFLKIFYNSKFDDNKLSILFCVLFILISILFPNISSYISIIFIFSIVSLYDIDSLKTKLIFTILTYLFLSVMEVLIALVCTALFNVSVYELQNNSQYYIFAVILAKLSTYFIANIFYFIFKDEQERKLLNINFPSIIITILAFLSFLILGRILYLSDDKRIIILGTINMILIVLSLLFYLEYNNIYKENKLAKYEIDMLKQHIYYNEKYNNQIFENIEKIKEIKHNLTNQLIGIYELLNYKDINKAKKYIHDITDNLNISINKITYIGIPFIDSIIYNKIEIANSFDIKVKVEANIINIGNIEEVDLGVLVGCAFDNAIEAACQVNCNKYIYIYFSTKGHYLTIKMINSIIQKNYVNYNYTSKLKDKEFHGYGIKSIDKITKKYMGNYNINIQNYEFIISIINYELKQFSNKRI